MKDDMKKNAREFMSDENFELNDATLEEVVGGITEYIDTYDDERVRRWRKEKIAGGDSAWDTYTRY